MRMNISSRGANRPCPVSPQATWPQWLLTVGLLASAALPPSAESNAALAFRLGVALDLPVVHRSMGRVDEARVRYHRRFADKHAARLASGRGPWVDLRVPIVVPDGIAAAFDRTNLERLHARSRDEARRRHEAAGRPYAAPRNGPCPCGSGLRYRECHGSVDRP